MTTYNGSLFLPRQLSSFLLQDRQPDQLVICDDGSTDNTVPVIEDFARGAPFEVKVVRNAKNLGHERNFAQAIALCEGDIIFLADQDDDWFPAKLAKVGRAFADHPDALLIVNNVMITDEHLVPTGLTVIDQMRRSGLLGEGGKGLTLGCATSFRKELLSIAAPIPSLDFGHDSWIHECSLALDSRLVLPDVLQLYRRHANNASTWAFDGKARATPLTIMKPSAGQNLTPIWNKRVRALQLVSDRIRALGPEEYALLGARRSYGDAIKEVEHGRDAIRRRMAVFTKGPAGRALLAVRLMLRGDYRYFLGWRSFIKDLIR